MSFKWNLFVALCVVIVVGCEANIGARSQTFYTLGAGSTGRAPSASYQGPADVIANPLVYHGLRCVNSAYTGNVADVWDAATGSTTETLITCSSGGVLHETINSLATTCASGCRVKTLYDQMLGVNCNSASGCDMAQTTNANRPTYTQNCSGTKPCLTLTVAASQYLTNAGTLNSSAVPWTTSAYVARTGASGFQGAYGSATALILYNNSVNTYDCYAGSVGAVATATDGTLYALFCVTDLGSSATMSINGVTGTPGASGTTAIAGQLFIGGSGGSTDEKFTEGVIWAGSKAASKSAFSTNQCAYWGPSTC